jgi:pyridoxine 4-dehydrogenase
MNQEAETSPASLSGTIALGGEAKVHRLGFGAMRITGEGIWGPPKDPASAVGVLRRAVELGVNFIDIADSYGPDTSEELIAEALSPYPKDLIVATKGGWNTFLRDCCGAPASACLIAARAGAPRHPRHGRRAHRA